MSRDVLVIASEQDGQAEALVDRITGLDGSAFTLQLSRYPKAPSITTRVSSQSPATTVIHDETGEIDSQDAVAVFVLPGGLTDDDRFELEGWPEGRTREFLRSECDTIVRYSLGAFLDCRWINPYPRVTEGNKIRSLELARRLGLPIPSTLLTNELDQARSFITEHHSTVLKVATGLPFRISDQERLGTPVRSITTPDLDGHGSAPLMLQEQVTKEAEYRVTVVGSDVFTCRISSQDSRNPLTRMDYRVYDFEDVSYELAEIPAPVAARCVSLVDGLGLEYAAMDLILTPEGEYVFLEANTHGLWGWVEALTGMPIALKFAHIALEK